MPDYTRDDMKILAHKSPPTSVAAVFLEDFDYDPKMFRDLLEEHHLDKDVQYLFEMPFEDLPMEINNATYMGYISFRLSVGK
jgi:hypothetical protein